jgi:predicted lipoprotein
MRKAYRYIIGILAVIAALYFSLDLQKLDAYRATATSDAFDAEAYARDVWENRMPELAKAAPELTEVMDMLAKNPEKAFETLGHKLGISRTWYFMARGTATIEELEEENILVRLGSGMQVRLATAFIFGNTIRDGLGAVDIDQFLNMTDFNQVSVALNQIVKEEVVPGLLSNAKSGMEVEFTGAFEILEDQIDLDTIRIIPIQAILSDGTP